VLVKVLYFGMLKDVSGRSTEEIDVPSGTTLGDIFNQCATASPRLREYEKSIVLARNQEFASPSEPVSDGDEIALMPPVSGGTGYAQQITDPEGHFFALTRESIDVEAIKQAVLEGRDGALNVFEGVVRNNTNGRPTKRLEYECYEAMAVKMMARIGREIADEHQISRIGMVHRLGTMEIGETSVAIAVAAPHRKPAFAASLDGINRLKKLVPIWKKEFLADGEVWVDGEWDDGVLSL
jgi:molybdopterin synthase catalytic subunit